MTEPVVTDEFLSNLFPQERADEFFDALYGGAEAGAFDIGLRSAGFDKQRKTLIIEFVLIERPGHCMACNLTYGLPKVFEKHPVINLKGIIDEIRKKLGTKWQIEDWEIGSTQVINRQVNTIPVFIKLKEI